MTISTHTAQSILLMEPEGFIKQPLFTSTSINNHIWVDVFVFFSRISKLLSVSCIIVLKFTVCVKQLAVFKVLLMAWKISCSSFMRSAISVSWGSSSVCYYPSSSMVVALKWHYSSLFFLLRGWTRVPLDYILSVVAGIYKSASLERTFPFGLHMFHFMGSHSRSGIWSLQISNCSTSFHHMHNFILRSCFEGFFCT